MRLVKIGLIIVFLVSAGLFGRDGPYEARQPGAMKSLS